MKAKRILWPLLQRLDWAIYLLIVGVLLSILGSEVRAAIAVEGTVETIAAPTTAARSGGSPVATLSAGAIYALLVWIVIPGIVYAVAYVRAARRFGEQLAGDPLATVRAKLPSVGAKLRTDEPANSTR